MNKNFVCIKVDREERPDVDDIYMTALHAMEQRGGWPLSMFLMADGKPIIGGTYWPADDREINGQTVLGFKSVLNRVNGYWKDKPKEIGAQADHYAQITSESLARTLRPNPLIELDLRSPMALLRQ